MDLAVIRHVNNVVCRFPRSPGVTLVHKIERREKKSVEDRVDGDPVAEVMEVWEQRGEGSRCWWVIVRISVSIQCQVNPALVSSAQILFSWSVGTVFIKSSS